METDAATVAAGLSKAERAALLTLPLPRGGDPIRLIAERPFSSLWRKSSNHWDAMLSLEKRGVVERTVSRGETLWRPTRELGLAVRRELEGGDK